jgi:protein-tyrosine phosphatase
VLAMDYDNYDNLLNICPEDYESRISLFLSHAKNLQEEEVPDPYYGGNSGFDHVLDITEEASIGLLNKIRKEKSI